MRERAPREFLAQNSCIDLEKRVPVAPLVDTRYLSSLENREVRDLYGPDFLWPGGKLNSKAQIKGLQRHGYDILLAGSQVKYGRRNVVDKSNENWILEDEYGGTAIAPRDDTPRSREPAVSNSDDLDKLSTPDFDDGRLEHLNSISETIESDVFLLAGVPEGPFSFASYLRGPRNFMLDLSRNESFVQKLLKFTTGVSLKMVDSLARYPIDGIWVGDGLATGSLISPDTYREWALPHLERIVNRAHEKDFPVFYHVCGKTSKLIEPIADSGVDVFEVDSPDNSGLSLSEVLEKTSHRGTVIKGNIDPLLVANGEEEDIRRTTRDRIREARGSGRFILSSGCFLPTETPPENVQAMTDEAKKLTG